MSITATSSSCSSDNRVPALEPKPEVYMMAASQPLNLAIFFSSSICKSIVPPRTGTLPAPSPYFSNASYPAAITLGCIVRLR